MNSLINQINKLSNELWSNLHGTIGGCVGVCGIIKPSDNPKEKWNEDIGCLLAIISTLNDCLINLKKEEK